MLSFYPDIRKRITEEPKWYDSNGVPRYDKFHPDLCPNIYADEVILLEIACQNCGKRFFVEMNWYGFSFSLGGKRIPSFKERLIRWKRKGKKSDGWAPIHYGDPPAHGCTGDTMNCYDLRIVRFWKRGRKPIWGMTRRRGFEIGINEYSDEEYCVA